MQYQQEVPLYKNQKEYNSKKKKVYQNHYWPADKVPYIGISYCDLVQYIFAFLLISFIGIVVFGLSSSPTSTYINIQTSNQINNEVSIINDQEQLNPEMQQNYSRKSQHQIHKQLIDKRKEMKQRQNEHKYKQNVDSIF